VNKNGSRCLEVGIVYGAFLLIWCYWFIGISGQVLARLSHELGPYAKANWSAATIIWVALALINLLVLVLISSLAFLTNKGRLSLARYLTLVTLVAASLSCLNYAGGIISLD
jgi:hypothetical protein